jgi:Raf kinase inhibitor-like YbhB/YbcL family protein
MATLGLRLLVAVVVTLGTLCAGRSPLAAAADAQGRPILGYGQDEQFTAPGEPWRGGGPAPKVPPGPGYPRQPTLISPAFPDYGVLPLKYAPNAARMTTFDALTPPLAWTTPPPGTVSVVVTMTDMEASSGGDPQDLLLWAVINIPANTQMLAEGVPRGKTSMLQDGAFQRSFLTHGYIGPQPGANLRPHHYLFELYTLDRMLDVPRDVTLDQLKAAIKGHQTGQRGVLVATCCTAVK